MNFGKLSKRMFPDRNEIRTKNMSTHRAKDASQCQREKRWREYSMCCGQVVNGRRCPGSTAAAALCTGRSKSGWKQAFLRRSGPRGWNGMMNWRELAGNGKAWMAA